MRIIIIACVFLFSVGCNLNKNKSLENNVEIIVDSTIISTVNDTALNKTKGEYFLRLKAVGTEPFWSFYVSQDTFLFTELNEKIDSTYFILINGKPHEDIIQYDMVDRNKNKGTIQFIFGNCSDGMSDKKYNFRAEFTYKNKFLKGCGEELNGK